MANTKARAALDQIHAILNGEEWNSDTMTQVAAVIGEFGYTIYNPEVHDPEVANAPLPEDTDYSYEHLEAAACMWEHVLRELRRHREKGNMWDEFREAYGMAELRARVIRHAPQLEAAYQEAVKNGYDKDFDWEYVPTYMESHIVALLT